MVAALLDRPSTASGIDFSAMSDQPGDPRAHDLHEVESELDAVDDLDTRRGRTRSDLPTPPDPTPEDAL